VSWFPFDGAVGLNRAAAAGAVDLGFQATISALAAIVRGLPVLVIAESGSRQDFYFYVKTGSPIREPRDLRGAKIGFSSFGGAAHNFAQLAIKALGLERDVKFLATGGVSHSLAALKTGVIDIHSSTFFSNAPLLVKGDIRTLLNTRDYLPGEWSDNLIMARRDFIDKSRELTKRATQAFLAAADYVVTNRSWSVERLKTYHNFDQETALAIAQVITFSKEGKVNKRALENVIKFLLETGQVEKEKVPSMDTVVLEIIS